MAAGSIFYYSPQNYDSRDFFVFQTCGSNCLILQVVQNELVLFAKTCYVPAGIFSPLFQNSKKPTVVLRLRAKLPEVEQAVSFNGIEILLLLLVLFKML